VQSFFFFLDDTVAVDGEGNVMVELEVPGVVVETRDRGREVLLSVTQRFNRLYEECAADLSLGVRRMAELMMELRELRIQDREVSRRVAEMVRLLGPGNYVMKQCEEILAEWDARVDWNIKSRDLEMFDWICNQYIWFLERVKRSEDPRFMIDYRTLEERPEGAWVDVTLGSIRWRGYVTLEDFKDVIRRISRNMKLIAWEIMHDTLADYLTGDERLPGRIY